MSKYFTDKDFTQENIAECHWTDAEYDNCSFDELDLTSFSIENTKFIECRFKFCNLASVKIHRSSFRDVTFEYCKLIGLQFETINPMLFKAVFEHCNLENASFYDLNVSKCSFNNCNLTYVEFTNADLSNVDFNDCNLMRAVFENTKLVKTSFTSASNFDIDPDVNFLKSTKFNKQNLEGLLGKYDIIIE